MTTNTLRNISMICVIRMTLSDVWYLMDSRLRKLKKSRLLDGVQTGKREEIYPQCFKRTRRRLPPPLVKNCGKCICVLINLIKVCNKLATICNTFVDDVFKFLAKVRHIIVCSGFTIFTSFARGWDRADVTYNNGAVRLQRCQKSNNFQIFLRLLLITVVS